MTTVTKTTIILITTWFTQNDESYLIKCSQSKLYRLDLQCNKRFHYNSIKRKVHRSSCKKSKCDFKLQCVIIPVG